jgi:hypothetical protein
MNLSFIHGKQEENEMTPNLQTVLKNIPQQFQRQDSTIAQLRDLQAFANKLGMYDAADMLKTYIRVHA